MGRQLRFFLTPTDLLDLETRLREKVPFTVLEDQSPTPEPTFASGLEIPQMGKTCLNVYLVDPGQVSAVRYRHIATTQRWSVDTLLSPVLECGRCYFDGKILRQGRFYYQTGYYLDDGTWQQKPDSFLAWASRLMAATKKALKRDASREAYVGKEALELQTASAVEFVD
jgi:hypothetical protein